MPYNIEIRDRKKKTYYFRDELKNMGFKFKRTSEYCSCWYAHTDDKDQVEVARTFCKKHKFKFFMYEDKYERSSNYRKIYFENNKPMFRDYYICAYCGMPLKGRYVTVDHIIPVKKAKRSRFYQKVMKSLNINDVNDPKNLVSACYSCNARKSSKGRWWVIKGFIGKNKKYWIVNILFWFISINWVIYFLYGSMMELVP